MFHGVGVLPPELNFATVESTCFKFFIGFCVFVMCTGASLACLDFRLVVFRKLVS